MTERDKPLEVDANKIKVEILISKDQAPEIPKIDPRLIDPHTDFPVCD